MRVKVKNLGGGLFKLKVERTCPCERVNNGEMDNIARDVARRQFGTQQSVNQPWLRAQYNAYGTPCQSTPQRPTAPRRPTATRQTTLQSVCRNGKPVHGFDAHIDVPQRKDFRSYCEWATAMNKFYRCEAAVKACDWPSVEEPKWAPTQQAAPARQPQRPTPCGCWEDDDFEDFEDFEGFEDFEYNWFE